MKRHVVYVGHTFRKENEVYCFIVHAFLYLYSQVLYLISDYRIKNVKNKMAPCD